MVTYHAVAGLLASCNN